MPEREKGPWSVNIDDYNDVRIVSNDMTHDVNLVVTGDFETVQDKKKYASAVAKVLNAAMPLKFHK